jgi:gamma-glutamyltranspeptidase
LLVFSLIFFKNFRDILLQGGNAVDAAISVVFCIGVINSQSSGLGGGHFMTIFNAYLFY